MRQRQTGGRCTCSEDTKAAGSHQSGRGRKDPPYPPQPSEGAWPGQHLDFGLPTSRTEREIFCSQLPSLWSFVTAAPGSRHPANSPSLPVSQQLLFLSLTSWCHTGYLWLRGQSSPGLRPSMPSLGRHKHISLQPGPFSLNSKHTGLTGYLPPLCRCHKAISN